MSNEDHALENAIDAILNERTFEEWSKNDSNLKSIKATPEEIWSMSQYVLYDYVPWYYNKLYKQYKDKVLPDIIPYFK